jgi:hypothetical protein
MDPIKPERHAFASRAGIDPIGKQSLAAVGRPCLDAASTSRRGCIARRKGTQTA